MRKTFLGEPINSGCIGCGIVNDEFPVPGGTIYETANFRVQLDPEVPIEYFFIIGAKRHVRYIHELTENELSELAFLLRKTRTALHKLDSSIEFTVIIEERSRHLHVWLFPRLPWMEGHENSLSSIRPIMRAAKEKELTREEVDKILKIAADAAKLFEIDDI